MGSWTRDIFRPKINFLDSLSGILLSLAEMICLNSIPSRNWFIPPKWTTFFKYSILKLNGTLDEWDFHLAGMFSLAILY